MSGHSHWRTIKHKKELADKKRGKIFGKLSRAITLAARQGSSPETNMALKAAIETAREFSLPKENIERAIARGTKESSGPGSQLEEVIYEALGPEGIAIIIEAITDNRNRTLGELRQIMEKYGGKIVEKGSLIWMFNNVGRLQVNHQENKLASQELELKAIEAGAKNIFWRNGDLIIDTDLTELNAVKDQLVKMGIKTLSARSEWVAKEEIVAQDPAKFEQLFEELDENDAVQEIYSNLKI